MVFPNGFRSSKACGGVMLPQNNIIMYTVHHAFTRVTLNISAFKYLKMNRPMSWIWLSCVLPLTKFFIQTQKKLYVFYTITALYIW